VNIAINGAFSSKVVSDCQASTNKANATPSKK
jgi:hypothetical protein